MVSLPGIGILVKVDDDITKKGYVIEHNNENSTVTLRWAIGGITRGIEGSRCRPVEFAEGTGSRSGTFRGIRHAPLPSSSRSVSAVGRGRSNTAAPPNITNTAEHNQHRCIVVEFRIG